MIDFVNEDVQHVFETNPGIDHVYITEDKHTFLPKFKQFCEDHCKLNNIKFAKLLRVAIETKSVTAVAVELVGEILDNVSDDTDLESLSFKELKERCKKMDLRCNPKNKKEAIDFLKNASNTEINEEVSHSNTEE